jgi:hypothetical protein
MPSGTGTVKVPTPMPVDLPPPTPPDATGRRRVYVNPPVIHIGIGDERLKNVRFTNHTGDTVRIWLLEAASLFVPPVTDNEGNVYKDLETPFVVKQNGTLDVKVKPKSDYGDYYYHVYCDAIGHEADGNSPPGASCP